MIIHLKIPKIKIEELLFALVLNLNAIRFLANISESSRLNIVIYFIFIACIGYGFSRKKDFLHERNSDSDFIVILMLTILSYGSISLIWTKDGSILQIFKLAMAFLLFILGQNISLEKAQKILLYTIIINIVYSIVMFLSPQKLNTFYKTTNYLSMSLTLGLSSTIALSCAICKAFSRNGFKDTLRWSIVSVFLILSCMRFPARGALLFPLACTLLLILIIGFKNKARFIPIILATYLLFYIGIQYFLDTAESYALVHMTRLFSSDIAEESRLSTWRYAISLIIERGWFLVGGGLNAFNSTELGFYPHNIFIQMCGEYGLIGTWLLLYICIKAAKNFFNANKIMKDKTVLFSEDNEQVTVYVAFTAMLYLLLTFSKSFSMYDAYALFLMLGISCSVSRDIFKLPSCGRINFQ